MYVCTYVCMYLRMYVCMYVCMRICMCVCVDVWMYNISSKSKIKSCFLLQVRHSLVQNTMLMSLIKNATGVNKYLGSLYRETFM